MRLSSNGNEPRTNCFGTHVCARAILYSKFYGEYCESFWYVCVCVRVYIPELHGHVDARTANFYSVETSHYYTPFIL